jgi:hypothetical protein
LRYLARLIRILVICSVYALVIWYGLITTADLKTSPILTKIAIGVIALGITGSIYTILVQVAKEIKGATMVLAEFLNRHLLEPQKQRLLNQGRAEGKAAVRAEARAEARAEIIADVRARLLEEGIDPDRIVPPEEMDGADPSGT